MVSDPEPEPVTVREDEGRLSQQQYQTIFDNIADGCFIHPVDSDEILEVNQRLVEILGYTRDELLGMSVSDITADDWNPPVSPQERIHQARTEGQIKFEWRDQRKDGTAFWAEVNLTVVELDGVERVLASVRDISDRKKQERRTRAIFDQTYQFTGLMQPDGTLIEANETALEFGDLKREDVIGKPVWDCYWFEYDESIQERVRQAVATGSEGEFVRQTLEVRGSDGTEMIDFSVRPVTDERGTVTLLIPEGRVVTEILEHRQQLHVYNRILRHNIRNKLTVVNGLTGHIRESTNDTEISDLATRVLGASHRIDRMTEQIREFDRIRQGDIEPKSVSVDTVVGDVAEEFAESTESTTILTDIEEDLAIHSNPVLLELIAGQLVDNAITHGGSTVRISASEIPDPDWQIKLTIADNGSGITPDEFEPVLNDVSTQLEHTTGVGLLIAKWSVDELDGEMEFLTEDEKGTTVVVRLPPSI